MHRLFGLFAGFVLLSGSAAAPAIAHDRTLTVFAAASMKNALDDIDAAYTAKTGVKVVASYAASLGARQADRTRRAGGCLCIRRYRLDGLRHG